MKNIFPCTVPAFVVWAANNESRDEPLAEAVVAWEQIMDECGDALLKPLTARGMAVIEGYERKADEADLPVGIIVSDRFHANQQWCTLAAVPASTKQALALLSECECECDMRSMVFGKK